MDDIRPQGSGSGRRVDFSGDMGRAAPQIDRRPVAPARRPVPVSQPSRPLHQNIPPQSSQYQPSNSGGRSKKPIIIILIFLLLLGGGAAAYWFVIKKDPPAKPKTTQNAQPAPEAAPATQKTTTRIIAAGDMLPHDALNAAAKTAAGYDYMPFMKNFQPYFQKADIRFCVQGVPGGGEPFGISGYPIFNSPLEFTRDMALLGCNVVNTGTNHTNDKGQPLIDATVAAWDKQQGMLAVAGANRSAEEQAKIRYFEKDGLKFAFLSYVTYSNTTPATPYGVNTFNEATAKAELTAARAKSDIILVSMRWGTEYSPDINPRQEELGNFLAANGADIVFGHGQHVQGPVKKLPKAGGGETLIWYGIGNFINAQLQPETLFNGIPVVDIDIATKKVSNVAFLPFYMHYEWTAAEKAAQKLLARKNFMMYTFDQAADPLAKSQNKTTIEAQTARLQGVLNKFTPVKILEANQY